MRTRPVTASAVYFSATETSLMMLEGQEISMATSTTGPRVSDIKRLYAVSGNRCALPACDVRLFDEGGIALGEMFAAYARRVLAVRGMTNGRARPSVTA